MKEMYLYCEKYNKWKDKREFANIPVVTLDCEEPRRTNCGICPFNQIRWEEKDDGR